MAKALGVELQRPRLGATEREVGTIAWGCSMARRASLLPTSWEMRKTVVVGGGAAAMTSWARLCRPARKVDRQLYAAASRYGICGDRWISASQPL
eukprot:15192324-Alexandrium_andersonii.AAC.2